MSDLHARQTELTHLHPAFRARIGSTTDDLADEGLPFRVFEAYRSPARQSYLYAQGRTRPGGVVTYAKAWSSYHQYGLAADFVLHERGRWSWDDKGSRAAWWKRLHEIGRKHGLEPLGFEKPHLQLSGVTLRDLQAGRFPADGDDAWAEHLEGQVAGWAGSPSAPPAPRLDTERPPLEGPGGGVDLGDAPKPETGDWRKRYDGRAWRYDAGGVYLQDVGDGQRPLRTPGEPTTCGAIWRLYGEAIAVAARAHKVPPELLVMTVATETAFARKHGFTGPLTFRWEPAVKVADVSPPLFGDYSAGPMQTLATTARWVIRARGLDYDPFVVAPVYDRRPAPPPEHPLYEAALSVDLGAAVIRQRWDATGGDPLLVAAAYNAGGVYESDQNAWHLRSHGDHFDRAARWYGDACAVLADVRA